MKLGARRTRRAQWTPRQPVRAANSGWWTPGIVAVFCMGVLLVAYNHQRGNFHRLRTVVLDTPPPGPPPSPGPGGKAPLSLTRVATSMRAYPEFLSATMLPGRGFEVFQISAAIPGHGQVNLLHSPDAADGFAALTDKGADAHGAAGTTMGAAFLAPWSGVLEGQPSSLPGMLQTSWGGRRVLVPAAAGPVSQSAEGTLLDSVADTVSTSKQGDGETVHSAIPCAFDRSALAVFGGCDDERPIERTNDRCDAYGGQRWQCSRSGRTGVEADFSTSWGATAPGRRFLCRRPAGLRQTAAECRQARPSRWQEPTLDLNGAEGTPLGKRDLDATYVDLRQAVTATGPTVTLRDTTEDYGLRLIALNGANASVHVVANPSEPWISVEMGSNRDDALGHAWGRGRVRDEDAASRARRWCGG